GGARRHPGVGRGRGGGGKAQRGSSRFVARTGRCRHPRHGPGRFGRTARGNWRDRSRRNRPQARVQFIRRDRSRRQTKRLVTMSITTARKAEVIKTYAVKSGDTGSPEVQVALLSERINNLTEHFKAHVKDNHSRRGLLKLVWQGRQIVAYRRRTNEGRYKELIERLGIRR